MSTKDTATILTTVIVYLRLFLDKMLDFLFSLYWDDKKQLIPDLDKRHSILAESAVSLARRIKAKELKSEDLVRAVIERIKEVNPIINAVVRDRYEAALEDARQVDNLVAAGLSEQDANKPFLGVPFTTKESQEIKGFCNTIGLWSRRNIVSTEDSDAILLLKRAGAIPLAATNLPELLIWQETRNPVYGMTLNPHHTGRTPGGSSGAEAALCATYATPISLCSDIGGSTRMPAFYCGMFGHHPTAGITSIKGVYLRKGDEGDTMFCLGFISRRAEDLAPLTRVIAGDKAHLLHLDKEVNIKDIKFFYMESANDRVVSPVRVEMKNAMQRVVSKLSEEAGAPQRYSHAGFRHMYRLWSYWMSREPDDYMALYGDGQRPNAFLELAKKCVGMSHHCLFTILRLFELKYLPSVDAAWAENITKEMKEDLFGKLGDSGVLLLPSSPHAAPFNYSAVLRPFNFSYFAIVNVLKCPATQVPLGTNSVGLPIGIQVLAAPHNDRLCLAVAKYLEKEFGGAIMACKVKT